ncbi:MAG: ClbS/DfsB family four-helix bundle protein [Chloroflexi bacterium]|nr:ClbS/DfsB family four-helix bundle protein [Chloroflexota bacterium]
MTQTIEMLLNELDMSRERLLAAIETLSDEALTQTAAVGEWSVADVLLNLTAWESELVTAVRQLRQSKKPTRLLSALVDPDDYNQKRYEENKGRDLDRIFNDLMKVRLELEEWLEMFSDKQLADRKRYKWLKGQSIAQLVTQITIENENRYLPQIEQFARTWDETAEIIPLTAVTLNNPDQ